MGRHANGCCPLRDIAQHHGIGTDPGVVTNGDAAQHFGPSANIDMPPNGRNTRNLATCAEGHLMKNQAIHPYNDTRVNDNSSRMR